MLLCNPSFPAQSLPTTLVFTSAQSPSRSRPSPSITRSMITADRATTSRSSPQPQRRTISAFEARISLVFALASQSASVSQRRTFLVEIAGETAKYVFPKSFESRNLEEALMAVPDLETVNFRVLSRKDQYEIREVEPHFIAETTMPGNTGFGFNGASQSFNVLAEYLFGKNVKSEKMEMTTPVITRKAQSVGEKMDMTTPVITKKLKEQDKWQMSFILPSKYGSDFPLPKDPSVKITEVPRKIVAVVAFSGTLKVQTYLLIHLVLLNLPILAWQSILQDYHMSCL